MTTSSTPSIRQTMDNYMESVLASVHTSMPGKIVKYDHSKQRARVKLQVKIPFRDGTDLEIPDLIDVPVVFPSCGGAAVILPVEKGDTVAVFFSERSMEEWLSLGEVVSVKDRRRHSISDAFAFPGLLPAKTKGLASAKDKLEIIYGSTKFVIGKDGKVAIGSNSAELLSIFDDMMQMLLTAVTLTPMGPQPLSIVTDGSLAQLKAKLALILGSL